MGSLAPGLALAFALVLGHGEAVAQGNERVDLRVTVISLSNEPGRIDPAAAAIHEKLSRRFRYESLRVLETRHLDLALNELGSFRLPNGRTFQVRPLNRDERGVLMAVSVQDQVDVDLRVPRGKPVVVNAGSHEDGELVLSLESAR